MHFLLVLVIFLNIVNGEDNNKSFDCDAQTVCSKNDRVQWTTLKKEFDILRNLPNLHTAYAERLRQKNKFCTDDRYGYLLAEESLKWPIACVWTNEVKGACLPAPKNDYPYDYVSRDEWKILLNNVRKAAGCSEVAITDAATVQELHVCRERCVDLGFTTPSWILLDCAIFSVIIVLGN